MLKKAVQQGRSERRADAYPLGYVEGLSDARTMLADFFSILLWDLVENSGLNRWQRRGLAWRAWKDERRTGLVGALDESDRELRPERHDSTGPSLDGGGIPKAKRLEIVPGVVQKSLRALIVEIETPWAGQLEQWRDPSIE
ncbi:MAG: hypothetical protein ABIQ24_07790 [Nitrospiraceae bacterium]